MSTMEYFRWAERPGGVYLSPRWAIDKVCRLSLLVANWIDLANFLISRARHI